MKSGSSARGTWRVRVDACAPFGEEDCDLMVRLGDADTMARLTLAGHAMFLPAGTEVRQVEGHWTCIEAVPKGTLSVVWIARDFLY